MPKIAKSRKKELKPNLDKTLNFLTQLAKFKF